MDFGKYDLFVSPQGNDAWTGRLAEPNAEGTDGPLATLDGARQRIRSIKTAVGPQARKTYANGGITEPFTVWLRGGIYPLTKPVVFTPEDSAPVTFAAYPGETPIFDGGVRITGWQVTEINGCTAWVADLPEVAAGTWNFRQLFVNGRRAQRPRLPRTGLYRMAEVPGLKGCIEGGYTQFKCNPGEVKPFANLNEVEVVYVHYWIEERSTISAFDPDTCLVTMDRPSRMALVGSMQMQLADYYLDNVFDALTEPGEWYLDRANGKLHYLPLPDETPETAEIYAPRCLQLLGLVGKPAEQRYVEFLRFRGITFRHTDWRHPDISDGATFISSTVEGGTRSWYRRGKLASSAQASSDVPGVIYLEGARQCAIEDCTIEHVGWYGVELFDACQGVRIVGNTLRDLGAGGVKINGGSAAEPAHLRTGNVLVADNTIHNGGRIFHSGIGVLSMHANRVAIRHNHIYDLFYSGVSCGWEWGYQESVSRDNLIEKNHIHDIGQGLLSDMGGIYTLGVQPGTVLRGNLIHDVIKAHYGGWCIYPDEGSSHLLIENNVCYRTNGEVFHQHYGRENTVRNNIFAFGESAVATLSRADQEHRAFTLERNILITDGAPIFLAGWCNPLEARNHISDLNAMYDIHGQPVAFKALTSDTTSYTLSLEEWQAMGFDLHSLAADPQCVDPEQNDFTLADDSPALALGFIPFDLSDVGPRPVEQRE